MLSVYLMQQTMVAKLLTVVCILVSAGLVAGQYHFPAVIIDTPANSVCPPDSHIDDVIAQITMNVSNLLSEMKCGDQGYGWKQVAFLNMTDPDQTCPDAWRLYEYGSVRACGRPVGDASCDSVFYGSDNYTYTEG